MACGTKRRLHTLTAVAAVALATTQFAAAAPIELLTNGDFETGNFAGWKVTNLPEGRGSWFIDTPGTDAPVSGGPTSGAGGGAHGSFYAVSDQDGPGTHSLTQAFTVAPGASSVTLNFDMFVNNWGGGPFCNPGLDHTGDPVQCGRVDLLTGLAPAFDTGAGVLTNFFLGADAGTNPNDFTHYSFDITSLVAAGGTFQIRFAESDNQFFFNQGVDNVSVAAVPAAVPEPATLALLGIAFSAMGFARRRTLN